MTGPTRAFDAVVFDFSGVMVSSAFVHIGSYGADYGMTEDEFIEYLLGPYAQDTDHAWHKAERGEIGVLDWATDTMARAESDGIGLDLSWMVNMIGELEVHQVMVDAVRVCRTRGAKTSLLTNNIAEARDRWRPLLPLDELFDDVIDSSEVGLRKPNPAVFALALERLGGIEASRAVLLDDYEGNCAGARLAGMKTILVTDPAEAAEELLAALDG